MYVIMLETNNKMETKDKKFTPVMQDFVLTTGQVHI